jgi:toxin ParE1/3/4
MKVLLSDKARADLLRIYRYIAERNPTAAETLVRRIDEKFDQIAGLPFIGRERSSLAPGVRSGIVGNYLIFYTASADSITVVRVIDGRMDIDEEFRR